MILRSQVTKVLEAVDNLNDTLRSRFRLLWWACMPVLFLIFLLAYLVIYLCARAQQSFLEFRQQHPFCLFVTTLSLVVTLVGSLACQPWLQTQQKLLIGHPIRSFGFVALVMLSIIAVWMPAIIVQIAFANRSEHPPVHAAFLFYFFLDAETCDALVGDLEERYKLICTKFGHGRANLWYWKEALRSVAPVVWAWMKKATLKSVVGMIAWAAANGLVSHDSWLAALVEMWKRIRS